MDIANLYVNLGVKGSDKLKKGLDDTEKGLGDIKVGAFAAKAAIVAAIYALEHMMAASAKTGMELTQLSTMTGISTDQIQGLGDEFRQFGVTADQIAGSIRGVQKVITDIQMNKGMSGEFKFFETMTKFDPSKMSNTLYVFQKAQEFANRFGKSNPQVVENILTQLGLDPVVIQALIHHTGNLENVRRRTGFGPGEIAKQKDVAVEWAELNKSIEDAFGHFTANHGMELTKAIEGLVKPITKLADQFIRIATTAGAFSDLNKIIEGWGLIFDSISSVLDKIDELAGKTKDDKEPKKGLLTKIAEHTPAMLLLKAAEKVYDASHSSSFVSGSAASRSRFGGPHEAPVSVINQTTINGVDVNHAQAVKDAVNKAHQENNKKVAQKTPRNRHN